MNKKLLFFLLIPFLGFSQVQIGQDIIGSSVNAQFGCTTSFSADGNTFIVGSRLQSSIVKVYRSDSSGNWVQLGQNITSNFSGNYGDNVAISSDGNIIAFGGISNTAATNKKIGYFAVYENISGTWNQIGINVMGNIDEQFAFSLAMSSDGSIIAVSAPYAGIDKGKVSVYRNVSGTWTKIGSDINDGEIVGEYSGWDIDLSSDGNTLAVGTLRNAAGLNATGKVRVYQNVSGTWIKVGNDIVGENAYDTSSSVSLSANGNIVAIGSRFNDGNGKNSGSVRVYQNNSGNWVKIGQDIDGDAIEDLSGYSTSLSADGTVLAIGALGDFLTSSGYVYVYKNISGNWIRIGQKIDGKMVGETFGTSVSLSADGKKLVVGAPYNSNNFSFAGQARVYDLTSILASNDKFVSQNFNIYPNPTADILNISLENNLVLEHVTLYNNLGQVVKTTTENVIDVSQLSKGLYFVEVTTNQGKATKKVIVN